MRSCRIRQLLLICFVAGIISLIALSSETSGRVLSRVSLVIRIFILGTGHSFNDKLPDLTTDCDVEMNCVTSSPTAATEQPIQQLIPKILHQTFATAQVFNSYKGYIEGCLKLNPDWKYYLWTDQDIDLLVKRHYPHLTEVFKKFRHKLEKSDVARYLVLHKFGGIYIDMDVECRVPFHPALTKYSAFVDQESVMQTQILWNRDFTAMNSGMGAVPGHPFFNRTIAELLKVKRFGSPVFSTGPELLTRALKAYWKEGQKGGLYPVELLPDYVMSPLLDYVQNYRTRCTHVPKGKKQSILTVAKEKLKHNASLFEYEKGCLKLDARNYRLDADIGPKTIAIHQFKHLGYQPHAHKVQSRLFNAAKHFANRIHFFSTEK